MFDLSVASRRARQRTDRHVNRREKRRGRVAQPAGLDRFVADVLLLTHGRANRREPSKLRGESSWDSPFTGRVEDLAASFGRFVRGPLDHAAVELGAGDVQVVQRTEVVLL